MTAVAILLFLMLGAIAGTAHFVAIAKDAYLLVYGGPAIWSIGLKLGRLVLMVAILALAARHGWIDLLSASIGFMAARHYVMCRTGPTA